MYQYETEESVQFFLDNLNPMELFLVVFMKQDNTQGKVVGCLDPNKPKQRKSQIAIMEYMGDPEGTWMPTGNWKSFGLGRVLWISKL